MILDFAIGVLGFGLGTLCGAVVVFFLGERMPRQ
jgi:hypothetical protein